MSRLADYEQLQCISKVGPHSEVYRATHLETGTAVAIKRIKIYDMHPSARKERDTEVNLLQTLDHPNLIHYHEHFAHEDDLYIVMELAAGGQMAQKVESVRRTSVRIEESLLWRWLYDGASALAYLHSRRVLHRDVKPSHIFLGENGQAKLGDFGLSKVMSAKTQIAFSCVGTPFYMSPELVKGQGYAFGSDVWSLGCSIYELAVGYPAFFRADMDFYALGEAICNGRYAPLPAEHWSREFVELVGEILAVDARNRPTAQRILDVAACKLVGRIQDFEIMGTVGRGKFSEVHRSLWKVGGDREVALKRVQIFEMETEARRECITEVNLLKSLNHSTIVRYLDSFVESSELVIVLELAPHGDLACLCRLLKESERLLTEPQTWGAFFQIADALHFMHKRRIMHRDIKPANVFLCSHGVVKLGDLGLGRYFSSNTYRAHSIVGTPFYMSPEVIVSSGGYSFKSDIWSHGCVLYELAALSSPFASSRLNYYALGNKIRSGDYPPLPEGTPPSVRGLCAEMIQVSPDARPSAHAVFDAAMEHFARCTAQAPAVPGSAGSTDEAPSEARQVHQRLKQAAAVVRATLEALLPRAATHGAAAAGAASTDQASASSLPSSQGSSAYPSTTPTPAVSSTSAAYARAPDEPRRKNANRPPPITLSPGGGEFPERNPPIAPPKRGPPPQPPPPMPLSARGVSGEQSEALPPGAQSHRVGRHEHRRHVVGPATGSLSARASSRERLEPLAPPGPPPAGGSVRRTHTPERGRQPLAQVSHLRFAGGSMSEGWKPHQAARLQAVDLPPIQRPREPSPFGERAGARGSGEPPPGLGQRGDAAGGGGSGGTGGGGSGGAGQPPTPPTRTPRAAAAAAAGSGTGGGGAGGAGQPPTPPTRPLAAVARSAVTPPNAGGEGALPAAPGGGALVLDAPRRGSGISPREVRLQVAAAAALPDDVLPPKASAGGGGAGAGAGAGGSRPQPQPPPGPLLLPASSLRAL